MYVCMNVCTYIHVLKVMHIHHTAALGVIMNRLHGHKYYCRRKNERTNASKAGEKETRKRASGHNQKEMNDVVHFGIAKQGRAPRQHTQNTRVNAVE